MEIKDYLKGEFKKNNIPKYQKYFEEWFNNLTIFQLEYYSKLWNKP